MAVDVAAAPGMVAVKSTAGAIAPRRLSKEELVGTHKKHLDTQNNSPHAPRAVKQPILTEAYQASIKSIRELGIVSFPASGQNSTSDMADLTPRSR